MKKKILVTGADNEVLFECDTTVEAIQKAEYAISQDHRLAGKISIENENFKEAKEKIYKHIIEAKERGEKWWLTL